MADALTAHSALVDSKLKTLADELQNQHAQLTDRMERTTSPTERAKLRKLIYEIEETAGAMRYSPVTGSDASYLE